MKGKLIRKIAFCSNHFVDFAKLEMLSEEKLKELCKLVCKNNREYSEIHTYMGEESNYL